MKFNQIHVGWNYIPSEYESIPKGTWGTDRPTHAHVYTHTNSWATALNRCALYFQHFRDLSTLHLQGESEQISQFQQIKLVCFCHGTTAQIETSQLLHIKQRF
jgi:hypothetical protein